MTTTLLDQPAPIDVLLMLFTPQVDVWIHGDDSVPVHVAEQHSNHGHDGSHSPGCPDGAQATQPG